MKNKGTREEGCGSHLPAVAWTADDDDDDDDDDDYYYYYYYGDDDDGDDDDDDDDFFFFSFFQWVMLRKGHGDLYKAPTKEERRKRAAKTIER